MMTISKLCRAALVTLGVGLLWSTPGPAEAGNAWLDPAIRHTNGMPIASSDPYRTTSVSWTCNPDKLGYCGGYYYRPCLDSLRVHRILDASNGCYTPAGHRRYQSYIGCLCPPSEPASGVQGIEPVGMVELGPLPNDAVMGLGGIVPSPAGRAPGR